MSDGNFQQSLRCDIAKLAQPNEQQVKQPKTDSNPKLVASTTTNASLWLDKLLHAQLTASPGDYQHPYTTHIKAICECGENENYREFFQNRWLPSLPQKNLRIATTIGRLVVGLGSESAWENNITLHRTYGVPYIPGSALKGLAAAYAHKYLQDDQWRKPGTKAEIMSEQYAAAHKVMFGDTTAAGYVTFFDALYVPDKDKVQALWPDVITVHHPEYYRETKQTETGDIVPPADWDDPTPIPFVSATGKYLIALAGPDDWVATAFSILKEALCQLGVGAKTSSGYGRMKYLNPEKQKQCLKQFERKKLELPDSFKDSIKKANASGLSTKINLLQGLPEELRRKGAELIIERSRAVFGKKAEDKPWFQELLTFLTS